MDKEPKDNEIQKVKNLSEVLSENKSTIQPAGCSHYKRKAKFVVRT